MRREEGGAEAEEGKLLLNEIRTGAVCAELQKVLDPRIWIRGKK